MTGRTFWIIAINIAIWAAGIGAAWSVHFSAAALENMGPFIFFLAVVWILAMTTSGSFTRRKEKKKQVGRNRRAQRSFRSLPGERQAVRYRTPPGRHEPLLRRDSASRR